MERIPVQTRVELRIPGYAPVLTGTVAGIAWETALLYGMIIILDSPLELPEMKGWTAVCATPDMVTQVG